MRNRKRSIKMLAKSLAFAWRDADPSGAASIDGHHGCVESGDPAVRRRILDYNEDDCRPWRYRSTPKGVALIHRPDRRCAADPGPTVSGQLGRKRTVRPRRVEVHALRIGGARSGRQQRGHA